MFYSLDHGLFFANKVHREFYEQYLCGQTPDAYTKALIYTLGICGDTRRNIRSLYDFDDKSIKPDAITEGWQTSGSIRITRLAFNLFTDRPATAYNENVSGDFDECRMYSVSDIFCCEFAPYFVEAIKLRYPEFMNVMLGLED